MSTSFLATFNEFLVSISFLAEGLVFLIHKIMMEKLAIEHQKTLVHVHLKTEIFIT